MLRYVELSEEEFENFYRLVSDDRVCRYMRFDRQTRSEAKKLWEAYRPNGFAVYEEDRFVGIFAFFEEEKKIYGGSLFLSPDCWGNGYATEILKHFVAYARSEMGAKELRAKIVSENIASLKAAENAGFRVAGVVPSERGNLLELVLAI